MSTNTIQLVNADTLAATESHFTMHYRTIAGSDLDVMANGASAIYIASRELLLALLKVTYPLWDEWDVYEWAIDAGELPTAENRRDLQTEAEKALEAALDDGSRPMTKGDRVSARVDGYLMSAEGTITAVGPTRFTVQLDTDEWSPASGQVKRYPRENAWWISTEGSTVTWAVN